MEDTRKVVCERCRKFVPISDIKYLPKGDDSKIALCSACRAKEAEDAKKEKVEKEKPQKKSYICSRCNYKFKHDPKGVTNLKCPYCGKADKVSEFKVKSADVLISESQEF